VTEPQKPYVESDADKLIRFPGTGTVYRVAAVNETMESLTFEVIGDPLDRCTESFADLVAVDAVVIR
jgi:hypothetical protein